MFKHGETLTMIEHVWICLTTMFDQVQTWSIIVKHGKTWSSINFKILKHVELNIYLGQIWWTNIHQVSLIESSAWAWQMIMIHLENYQVSIHHVYIKFKSCLTMFEDQVFMYYNVLPSVL